VTVLSAFRTHPGRVVLSLATLAAGLSGITGCDSTATIFPQRLVFQSAQIVSAYPGKKTANGWERVCDGGAVDGIMTNVVLTSNQRSGVDGTDDSGDLSIRPGDIIEGRTINSGLPGDIDLSNPQNMSLKIDCIDPVPRTTSAECAGATPAIQVDQIKYNANTPDRDTAHNVILLLDQSGSLAGLVDADEGNKENKAPPIPSNFGDLASDGMSVRIAAAKTFIDSLGPKDRLGVIAFGEDMGGSAGLQVQCEAATTAGTVQDALKQCYGRNRDLWTTPGQCKTCGIERLIGQASGRSDLWKALDIAYEFLKSDTSSGTESSNHIVVITDGPDTCLNGENLTNCASACSSVGSDDVIAKLNADADNPNAKRIHIHFVQFESLGYPGRDPRQIEASCVTGGHYQYINMNQFPRLQRQERQGPVEQALSNVRFALMGAWSINADVIDYASPTGSPPGSMYALSGALTIAKNSNMVRADEPFPFDIGQGDGFQSSQWDRRLSITKPCSGPSDCGGAAANACTVSCSEETHTCGDGLVLPDTALCDGGFCCDGTCQAGGACAACSN